MSLTHYIIVRADLPLGVIAAQTTHAAGESFGRWSVGWTLDNASNPAAYWPEGTTAVVLGVPDEQALKRLESKLRNSGMPYVAIREPDPPYFGALMAIGLHPVADRADVAEYLQNYTLL